MGLCLLVELARAERSFVRMVTCVVVNRSLLINVVNRGSNKRYNSY